MGEGWGEGEYPAYQTDTLSWERGRPARNYPLSLRACPYLIRG